jgi:phosphoribosylformylglycinamidine cyclo-ligase
VIADGGPVEEPEMRRTFNIGVGLCAVVAKDAVDRAIAALEAAGERAFVLGDVVATSTEERITFV